MTDPKSGLALAFASVERLEKDGSNQHKKYKYASAELVKRVTSAALSKAGMFLSDVRVDPVTHSESKTSTGATQHLVVVKAVVTVEQDGTFYRFEGIGAATDYGAEAFMKAQTVAMREACKNILLLSTADKDMEDDSGEQPAPAAAPSSQPLSKDTQSKIKQMFSVLNYRAFADMADKCREVTGLSLPEIDEASGQKLLAALNAEATPDIGEER